MPCKHYLGRLPKGGDLVGELNALCKRMNISRGSVQVIGALEKATLGYYDQDDQVYENTTLDEHLEVLSGLGNVSIKDGEPFTHLHLVLGKRDLSCVGGHAQPGCVIFAAEAYIQELDGPGPVRGFDEPTGLPLWDMEG